MIKTIGLKYTYEKGSELEFPDLEFAEGEHALFLGQSGCGKTTLLHLLSGLRVIQSGSVEIDGVELGSLKGKELDKFRGQNVGIVFQVPHFIEALSVEENISLAQELSGTTKNIGAVQSLLDELGIGDKSKKKITQLSQGEKQRVSIARALINNPSIILADEPTSALDDKHCDIVIDLLKKQAEKCNATLLIVTHDGRLKDQFEKRVEL